MSKKQLDPRRLQSRRAFVQRVGAFGAIGLAAGLLPGCGGESQQAADQSCTDTSGLSEQAIQMREGLGYVDQSPMPDKVCDNCAFWEPAERGEFCGGCQLLEGPIHPKGYCNSWAPVPEEPAA